MKSTSTAALAALNAARTSPDAPLAFADCFTFTLATGTALTWTNFDQPVLYGGATFSATGPLVQGLKYRASVGLEVDKQQIIVAARPTDLIGSAPVLAAIRQGAFDGAVVQRDRVFLSGVGGAALGGATLFHGRVSTVDQVGRTTARLTVASDLVVLDYDMPRNLYSPTCLHTLYDSGCGVIRGTYSASGTVGAGSTAGVILTSVALAGHVQGSLVFTSGVNANLRATVKSVSAGVSLSLMYPLPEAPAVGDAFTVAFGCDHTRGTCQAKFANLSNFRGYPLCPHPKLRTERARVVAEARAWIGTPYHHMADLRGVGVDCAMILVRVFCDLGLLEAFDPRPYARDWMLHRDDERYLGFIAERAREVAAPSPGDLMLFRVGRCYAHGGFVTEIEPLTLLHAFAPAARVIEEPVARNAQLAAKRANARFFSLWSA